jgi:sulfide:quinone oxidoreductase
MKTILILGAGTAGTAIAHKLRRRLSKEWDVAVVDPSSTHLYQPGLLFLPFGDETEERILRERGSTLGKGITWHQDAVKAIESVAPRSARASPGTKTQSKRSTPNAAASSSPKESRSPTIS